MRIDIVHKHCLSSWRGRGLQSSGITSVIRAISFVAILYSALYFVISQVIYALFSTYICSHFYDGDFVLSFMVTYSLDNDNFMVTSIVAFLYMLQCFVYALLI